MEAQHTVVAMYMDAEIGMGEGETYEYAMRECLDSIPAMYPAEDVELVARNSAMPFLVVTMPMDLAVSAFA